MKIFLLCAALTGLVASSAFAAAAEGKVVFDKSCKTCHGPDGKGNPGIAKMMKVEMKALGSKEVQSLSDAQLREIITKGKGKMKAPPGLSAKDVTDVIAFVRTLK